MVKIKYIVVHQHGQNKVNYKILVFIITLLIIIVNNKYNKIKIKVIVNMIIHYKI